jgi:lipopolysaccharide/colanic/teichoic acid biosynthesis glycosyltransferase
MTHFTTSQKLYMSLVKRPIGFLGALVALILLSPVFLATIVLLFFANKGAGVFFTQDRPGKNEKIFKALKFKTMTDERDAEGNLLPDSERLTPVGKFVRSTSIDELPQLINILKGDMAFIGPRPLLVQYLTLYSDEQHRRHDVTPGMSGWAQVNGRNNISWTKKFEYDVYYVDHIGAAMDRKVFFTTIKKVLMRSDINTTTGQSATMDYFDGTN